MHSVRLFCPLEWCASRNPAKYCGIATVTSLLCALRSSPRYVFRTRGWTRKCVFFGAKERSSGLSGQQDRFLAVRTLQLFECRTARSYGARFRSPSDRRMGRESSFALSLLQCAFPRLHFCYGKLPKERRSFDGFAGHGGSALKCSTFFSCRRSRDF